MHEEEKSGCFGSLIKGIVTAFIGFICIATIEPFIGGVYTGEHIKQIAGFCLVIGLFIGIVLYFKNSK